MKNKLIGNWLLMDADRVASIVNDTCREELTKTPERRIAEILHSKGLLHDGLWDLHQAGMLIDVTDNQFVDIYNEMVEIEREKQDAV